MNVDIKNCTFEAAEIVICNALMTFPFTTSTDLRVQHTNNTLRDFPGTFPGSKIQSGSYFELKKLDLG